MVQCPESTWPGRTYACCINFFGFTALFHTALLLVAPSLLRFNNFISTRITSQSLLHHHPYVTSVHGISVGSRAASHCKVRAKCKRRFAVEMQYFKDTPQIHLITPMSLVTNRWTSSVTRSRYHTKTLFLHICCRHSL